MHISRTVKRLIKKPMAARFFAMWLCALSSVAAAQSGPPPHVLDERAMVAQVLQRPDLALVASGDALVARGEGDAAVAYPNPALRYVREQTSGADGSSEDQVTIAQAIGLSGRRGDLRIAARARVEAARLDGELTRARAVAVARARFYALLLRQARADALGAWVRRIDEALEVVSRRERGGEAALYDRRRLERERAVASARVDVERARLEVERGELLAVLGGAPPEGPLTVVGTLLPPDEAPPLEAARVSSASRPEVRALAERVTAAALEADAAERAWIPDVVLEGGYKGTQAASGERSPGFIAGVSLSLPLWDQAGGQAQAAAGAAERARGEHLRVEAEASAALEGAHTEAALLRRAAQDFGEKAATGAELVRIATAGYAGGELSVLELLDAYRGATDDALLGLDLEHDARRARLDLERLTGATTP
jgi:cobalt-zinc-cadmium efflux system outer membrane protein